MRARLLPGREDKKRQETRLFLSHDVGEQGTGDSKGYILKKEKRDQWWNRGKKIKIKYPDFGVIPY